MTFSSSSALATCILLCSALAVLADPANGLSDAEIQGRALAQKILGQWPSENLTNSGFLQVRDADGRRTVIPIQTKTVLTPAGWKGVYQVTTNVNRPNGFVEIAHGNGPNVYWTASVPGAAKAEYTAGQVPSSAEPFAGSDFWVCDLGLEFFHWPQQKIIKKEFHRNCACMVLESTNPHPAGAGYSRVVAWIDEDSLGIVEAYAYDENGRELKNFYPKVLEKVNGQYQVQSMVLENRQTGSKSVFDFDLHK
jgi:hypothetical protein